MLKLRPYQKELISNTAKLLTNHCKVVMCAPTGSGKTVMFSDIIARHLERNMFNRVLVMTHRVELFAQTITAIVKAGTSVAQIKAGQKVTREHGEMRCVVAMVETLKRRKELPGIFSLVICDEAHRADFTPVLKNLPQSTLVIGATATPISSSKKKPLKSIYQNIAISVSIPDLIEKSYLAHPITYKAGFDESTLKVRQGEFTDSSQIEALGNNIAYKNAIDLWKQKSGNLKTLVFCINKAHTVETCQAFISAGIKAEYVLSGDKEREAKFSRFKSGETQVLLNCEIATTGTDIPEIECIMINRATKSLPLWLQMVGRGARVIPNKKEQFTIVDFGGNVDRHGLWEQDRDWKQWFFNPDKAREGVAPMRECESCGAINGIGVKICPYCGHEQSDAEEKQKELVIGELIRVGGSSPLGKRISELTLDQLIALERLKVYKATYIWRVVRARNMVKEYAKIKNYSYGWVMRQKSEPSVYSDYIVNHKTLEKATI